MLGVSWAFLFGPAFKLWDWVQSVLRRREDAEWNKRFTDAMSVLNNALPRILMEGPAGFLVLVPDKEMRDRIEFYLIEPETSYSGKKVKVRTLSPEQLRSPAIRRTIQDVLDCVEKLKREKPDIAQRLRIP
jgi:hypothetical protein